MIELLPNLGAEEGHDWQSIVRQPAVRAAAQLWILLFPPDTRLHRPTEVDAQGRAAGWTTVARDRLWPEALGPPADGEACAGVTSTRGPVAWLKTRTVDALARERFGTALPGPEPGLIETLHDKAFAVSASASLGLAPRALQALVEVLEPEALRDERALAARLDDRLAGWPDWTGRRFTLKPRHGSSGRGRVGGQDVVDPDILRGALPRLAARGGAIFEPWLERERDFSVVLDVPPASAAEALPVLVGSLEMLASGSGLYRGHCGELDSRGRVFSGDPDDETLRADAAAVAALARERGHLGVCGVDAFRYRERPHPQDPGRARLRSAVEFNARPTMGLVAIGLVRRALAVVRDPLGLAPGERRAFALVQLDERRGEATATLRRLLPDTALWLDLTPPEPEDASLRTEVPPIHPTLLFARDRARLRNALRTALGC